MHGLILTQCDNLNSLIGGLHSSNVPLLKVVTGWGYQWNSGSIGHVCHAVPSLIVRTVNGDGTREPAAHQSSIFLEPRIVIEELTPWLTARPSLWCELGNEPNAYDSSDDAAWAFRYWFIETVHQLRARFPAARLISPGLIADRQIDWWAICQDAFSMADAIGFHAYAWHDFLPHDNGGQLQIAIDQLRQYYGARQWVGTELGINDAATAPSIKADRYHATHLKLPSQVAAVCWYHYTNHPSDPDQEAYALPMSALSHLIAGGSL